MSFFEITKRNFYVSRVITLYKPCCHLKWEIQALNNYLINYRFRLNSELCCWDLSIYFYIGGLSEPLFISFLGCLSEARLGSAEHITDLK